MITYKIHLIRHGITQANLERKYIGTTNPPLCESGIRQLKALLKEASFPSVERVYSSPLLRATQTAELFFPQQKPVLIDGMREIDFGEFEDRTIEDLEQDPAFQAWISSADMPIPGGECGQQVYERSVKALGDIFSEMMEERITGAALITHSGLISGLLANMGLPERESIRWGCDPGHGYTIMLTPQMWMRDQKFEVYARLPVPMDVEDPEETDYWQDLDFNEEIV